MTQVVELLLVLVLLMDLVVLGTTRLSTCIRAVAAQGVLLGLLPLALYPGGSAHTWGLAAGTILVKAVALPWLLSWAIREAAVRRQVEPRLGYVAGLLLGVAAIAASFAISASLPLGEEARDLLVPVALATVIIGLMVLTTRAKAVVQVVGYVMLENGVYLFGLIHVERVPFLVEVGVLLDVFVAVFIMGIVVFHISREFDTLDTARLTELTD
jgi:hydrogenase-4 component E